MTFFASSLSLHSCLPFKHFEALHQTRLRKIINVLTKLLPSSLMLALHYTKISIITANYSSTIFMSHLKGVNSDSILHATIFLLCLISARTEKCRSAHHTSFFNYFSELSGLSKGESNKIARYKNSHFRHSPATTRCDLGKGTLYRKKFWWDFHKVE